MKKVIIGVLAMGIISLLAGCNNTTDNPDKVKETESKEAILQRQMARLTLESMQVLLPQKSLLSVMMVHFYIVFIPKPFHHKEIQKT